MHSSTWLNFKVAPKGTVWLSRWYFKAIRWRVPSLVDVVVVVLVLFCCRLVGKVSCGWVLPLGGVQERLQVIVKVCRVEEHWVRDPRVSAGHPGVSRRNFSRHVCLVETWTRKHIWPLKPLGLHFVCHYFCWFILVLLINHHPSLPFFHLTF